jgi:uncharacterized protein
MRNIRRSDREISFQEAREILENGEYGVLSTVDKDGQPYGVPLSYVCRNESLYFHCALSGHKLDNIADNPRVSFCVTGKMKVLPEKFATEYESAVVFGLAHEVEEAERDDALLWLAEKYCAEFIAQGKEYISAKGDQTKVVRLKITGISGKARR